jgi:outer membrane lipoprotein
MQAFGAPRTIKKCLITNTVTTNFLISPCTPIPYASFLRPTATSRIMSIPSIGIILGVLFLIGLGCVSGPEVVPEVLQTQIDPSVTFRQMLEEPTVHQGAVVLLGGEVLSAKRLTEGTRLEILQLPLDDSEGPVIDRTASQGRFLAFESAFLDPATLPPNTRVTLVGEITGATRAKLDEMEYRYPTLNIKHLYVWPEPEWNQSDNSGPRYGIFGGGSSGGRVGGGVSIGIGF